MFMNGGLMFVAYTFAAMAGICFVSGITVLSRGRR